MPQIHIARLGRAQLRIAEAGVDAALITSPANVRYLTGLVSSNAAVLLPADGLAVLGTDSRYAETAERDCPDVELVIAYQIEPALARLAAARGWRTVAFEAQEMTVGRHAELSALDDCPQLVPLGLLVEQLRMVKDDWPSASPSPSSLESTCLAKAESVSRTLSLSAQALGQRRY